ncbi:MAG: VTC domain-containing protein [Anaerolineales bacterium]|nr:VTC domain-containing protein [Anaerolineales bacterium]
MTKPHTKRWGGGGAFWENTIDESEQRPYRYERKFLVEGLDSGQVHMLVKRHPAMFYQTYPPRHVNNLYLDTDDLRNYYANLDGEGERHKVRIRWYGKLFGEIAGPTLEFKVKRGLVGTKHTHPFPGFQLQTGFAYHDFQAVILASDLAPEVRTYLRTLQVVLCNRYYRWYYATRDGRFRLTIDNGLTYYQVRKSGNTFQRKYLDDRHVVVELKYEKSLDVKADRIAGFFPFSVTRNSKYITGIESIYP